MAGPNKLDSRQIVSRDTLSQIFPNANNQELDDLLRSIDVELQTPLRLDASSPASLVINVRGSVVSNTINDRNHSIGALGTAYVTYPDGETITFPSTSGNNVVFSQGSNTTLTVSSNNYIKGTVYLDVSANLNIIFGVENAVEADATVALAPSGSWPIGYITLFNNAGTIDAISQDKIYQFLGSAGGGAGLTIKEEGSTVDSSVSEIDFVGDVVTATQTSASKVQVTLETVKTITDMQKIGQVGLPVNDFTGGAYLATTDFPNTTTLYGWQAPDTDSTYWTDLGGNGKDLTRIGPLQIANDMLGNSKACDFDGTQDSLYSTDAAFAFTGTFSMGVWLYRDDWSVLPANYNTIISRYNGTTGWRWLVFDNSQDVIRFNVDSTGQVSAKYTHLTPGWHHFAVVRNTSTTQTSIYIDGTLANRSSIATAITAGGRLEVGAYDIGQYKYDGSIQDIWIHNATAWTDAQVFSIYSKAAANYQPQMFAGHNAPVTIAEPNLASSEVLAQYSFGANGSAITADDKSTYTLTNVGSVAESAGIFGGTSGAAYFNGSSQYFTQATLLDSVPSSIGISFWFKAVDGQPSSIQRFFRKVNNESSISYLAMNITTAGLIIIEAQVAGVDKAISSQTTLPNGQTGWYHVTMNWDTINGMRLWVNGVLEASNSSFTTLFASGTARDFAMGCSNYGGTIGGYFNGWIAQFKVINKILTQADVDILYSSKIALPSELHGKDIQLEASYRPNGIEAFEKNLNLDGIVVANDGENIYRAGLTNGSGLSSSDSIKIKGRF